MDKRLGKVGGEEPVICAVSGQLVRGQHSSHYHIGEGFYFAILEKVAMLMDRLEIEDARRAMHKIAFPPAQRRGRTVDTEADKEGIED